MARSSDYISSLRARWAAIPAIHRTKRGIAVLAGGRVKVGHVWVGTKNAPIKAVPGASAGLIVCKGWATAKTLHAANGLPVCMAFNAGNLMDVAKMIRARDPSARLIVAGDDDRETEGNPGRAKATEAAQAVGAEVVFPVFPPGLLVVTTTTLPGWPGWMP